MSDNHPSLDELAELDEDLLTPERAGAVRAHLQTCTSCRAGADALTATRSTLADLPAEPMPAHVRDRLEAVIGGEAAASSEPPTDPAVPSNTVIPNVIGLTRRRIGRPTMAASAAAAAVVLALGAIIVAHNHNSSGGNERAGAASGAVSGANGFGGAGAPAVEPTYPTSATGTDYTPAALSKQVSSLLSTNSTSAISPPSEVTPEPSTTSSPKRAKGKSDRHGESSGVLPAGGTTFSGNQPAVPKPLRALFSSPQKLLACAMFETPSAGRLPIAVDFGRWSAPALGSSPAYRAVPAVVLVYADTTNTVRVVVVTPPCNGESTLSYTEVQIAS